VAQLPEYRLLIRGGEDIQEPGVRGPREQEQDKPGLQGLLEDALPDDTQRGDVPQGERTLLLLLSVGSRVACAGPPASLVSGGRLLVLLGGLLLFPGSSLLSARKSSKYLEYLLPYLLVPRCRVHSDYILLQGNIAGEGLLKV